MKYLLSEYQMPFHSPYALLRLDLRDRRGEKKDARLVTFPAR